MEYQERKVDFREADRRYTELKRQHQTGALSAADFDDRLQQLMVQDGGGRWWAKSREDGQWHYHDGHDWIAGTPPGLAPSLPPDLPPSLPENPVVGGGVTGTGGGTGASTVEIPGVGSMDLRRLELEVSRGARFVVFQYCISVLVMSFKRQTDVHFFRPEESRTEKMLPFTILSLLLGWWGIPWGPIWTIQTASQNLRGGTDVTQEIMASLVHEGR